MYFFCSSHFRLFLLQLHVDNIVSQLVYLSFLVCLFLKSTTILLIYIYCCKNYKCCLCLCVFPHHLIHPVPTPSRPSPFYCLRAWIMYICIPVNNSLPNPTPAFSLKFIRLFHNSGSIQSISLLCSLDSTYE